MALASNSNGLESRVSTEVTNGSLTGYLNLAWASEDGVVAYQGFDEASGVIRAISSSEYNESLQSRTYVNTAVSGNITDYSDIALAITGAANITENSHITGEFESRALSGNHTRNRTSNFGHEFDLEMYAQANNGVLSGPLETTAGTVTYDIDPSMKIQDAVNSA